MFRPSTQIPATTMFRPPNPTPELLFNFTITPLPRFKQAIHALIDRHFNPIGFGFLEVGENGVEFTAQNVDTKATGILRLHSSGLQDFHFNRRCQERIMRINFRQILISVTDADETITLFRFAGSYNVTIQIGTFPVRQFPMRIISMVPVIERFHDTSFCSAMLPSTVLTEMINRLDFLLARGINGLVSASLSQVLFSVFVGNLPQRPLEHKFNDGYTITDRMLPGQVHHAWFILPHLEALRKASRIDPYFVISFLAQPREMIMTKHSLEQLGYLMMFSNRATKVLPNINRVPPEVANAVADAATAAAAAEVPMFDFRNLRRR